MTMGKNKKRRSKKHTTTPIKTAPKPKKRSKYTFFALAVGAALIIFGGYFLTQGEKKQKPSPESTNFKKANVNLREKGSTLTPQWFTGKVRRAYQVARDIPEVLDQLYCYCRCREGHGHKNLLSCYVETHAST